MTRDFLQDFTEQERARLASAIGRPVDSELDLHWICHALSRLVPTRPRSVEWSSEAKSNATLSPRLDAFLNRVRSGEDLVRHQTRRIQNPRRQDAMLVDFGLHHFHLAVARRHGERFVERSDHAAIAFVTADTLYLVDVVNHLEYPQFQDSRFIEIVHNNWPFLTEQFRVENEGLYGIGPPSEPMSAKERAQRLKANQSVPIYLADGTTLFPLGLGQTMAGTSLRGMHQAMQLHQLAHTLEQEVATRGIGGSLKGKLTPVGAVVLDDQGRVVLRMYYSRAE